jgi:ATP-dependent RNA helicase DDX19/DBP5
VYYETQEVDPTTYLHRIGRTGRFGRAGIAISFVHDEKTLAMIQVLQENLQKPIHEVPSDDLEEAEKTFKKFMKRV